MHAKLIKSPVKLRATKIILNQVHAWFLKIDPVRIVTMCVCMCVSAPKLLIASGMIWTP